MKAYEHRAIGDAATGGALVNLGGESPEKRLWLTFGDVVGLSGDFFRPCDDSTTGLFSRRPTGVAGSSSVSLFGLARVPGDAGTRLGSRDEILCALKVTTVDESFPDARFEPGGPFASFRFTTRADRSDVERRVRDRYLTLAAANDDHFVAPGPSGVVTGSGFGSARSAYRKLHQTALDQAWLLGLRGGDVSRAMAREAAAQHYLTDAFASGHLRTPVAAIRRYWSTRYPQFWEQLQTRVAADTARTLRELNAVIRLLPSHTLHRRTLSELTSRTRHYPQLSLGDLVARCFHDWDNLHGLSLEGGGRIFGDGRIDDGVTRELALAASRAGIDDIEAAFALGRSGRSHQGRSLYEAVRQATGASTGAFLAETRIPRPSDSNPAQNWRAGDVETLWDCPIVGATGITVGQALVAMLEPGGQFIRQLDGLGQGLTGRRGVFAVPVLGEWLSAKCCHAYRTGFVEPLAHDPKPVVLDLVHGDRSLPPAGLTAQPHLGSSDAGSSDARPRSHRGVRGRRRPARLRVQAAHRG